MLQNIIKPQKTKSPQQIQTSNIPHQQISCRICLQDMSPQQTFVTCLCKEANAQVHQKCLTQWAKKVQKYRQSFEDYYYYCEICRDKIYLKVDKKLICLNWRQVKFMGEQFWCSISALVILLMGLGMLVATLYLRLVSEKSSSYLFDIGLGCASAIILADLIITGIYFTVQTDITVTGIVIKRYLTKKQTINKIPSQKSVTNPNHNTITNPKQNLGTKLYNSKKQQNQLNLTQINLIQNKVNNGQQIQMFQQIQLGNQFMKQNDIINNQQIRGSQSQLKVNSIVLLKEPLKQEQQTNQPQQKKKHITSFIKQQSNVFYDQESKINIAESTLFVQGQKIIQSSLTSIQQHTINSIQVRSILCHSRKSYQTDPAYSQQPTLYLRDKNDLTSSNIQLQNDISHNQIASISKKITVKNDNIYVHKYRKTEPGYLLGVKKTISIEIGENIQQQNQVQEVQIYYPKIHLLHQ